MFSQMRDREVRVAWYSAFAGACFSLMLMYLTLTKWRIAACRKTHQPVQYEKLEPPIQCPDVPECPVIECPFCPDHVGHKVPEDLASFLDNHVEQTHGAPMIVARTRMKSTPNVYLSLPAPEKDMTISHSIITKGGWENHVIALFCHHMSNAPQGAFFVDVGAYIGTISLGVAACGFDVIAFEPHPVNFQHFEESIVLNPTLAGQVTTYKRALGNSTKDACIGASSTDQSNSRIIPSDSSNQNCPQGHVTMTTYDIMTKDLTVYAVNIDVLGFEPAVLAGMWKRLVSENPPKILRFGLEKGTYSLKSLALQMEFGDILKWIQKFGYSLRDEENDIVVDIDSFFKNVVGHGRTFMTAVFTGRPVI